MTDAKMATRSKQPVVSGSPGPGMDCLAAQAAILRRELQAANVGEIAEKHIWAILEKLNAVSNDPENQKKCLRATGSSLQASLDSPWVDISTVFQEGGFVVGTGGGRVLDYAVRARPGVITAYGVYTEEAHPPEWYFARTRGPFSRKRFDGKVSVVMSPVGRRQDMAWVGEFVDRASRLDKQGFPSYLLLSRDCVSERDLRELLSERRGYIPVVEGFDYPDSGMEGVPDFLWNSAYALFVSQLHSTRALFRHAAHVAQALSIPEEQALYLLSRVPADKYLRIPPARREM